MGMQSIFVFCVSRTARLTINIVRQKWRNIQVNPLIELNKILLLTLLIKLGVMKNFVKAMDREGSRFAFFQEKFPRISMEKLKAGIFDSPQIKELMKDPMFDKALSKAELSAWQSLKSVVTNFLENQQCVESKKEIEELVKSFYQFRTQMWVKLHFLSLHLDYFPKNCGDLREEQGEHFPQEICIIEECYQGLWNLNFLVDYCWGLKLNTVAAGYRKKSLKRPFIHE